MSIVKSVTGIRHSITFEQGSSNNYAMDSSVSKVNSLQVSFNGIVVDKESQQHFYVPVTRDEAEKLRTENEQLRALATIDTLTGLNNRRAFFAHVNDHIADLIRLEEKQELEEKDNQSVLVYIDLDNFKPINDNLGHKVGDKALKIVAQVFKDEARHSDFPARVGGDEFAILVPSTNSKGLSTFIEKLETVFDMLTMSHRGHKIKLGATIGTAVIDTTLSTEDNLDKADQVMYNIKRDKKKKPIKAESLTYILARGSKAEMEKTVPPKHQLQLEF